jgi:hypothetical protein
VPQLSGWRRPALPFSLRTVLRREYPGWFAAVTALAFIEIGADAFGDEPGGRVACGRRRRGGRVCGAAPAQEPDRRAEDHRPLTRDAGTPPAQRDRAKPAM